jgi:hypothetical protein
LKPPTSPNCKPTTADTPNLLAVIGSVATKPTDADRREQIVRTALTYRGATYRHGGTSPKTGFDCSGLVQTVCKKWGIYLPRVASEQLSKARGKRVLPYELIPGDLVFFSGTYRRGTSHVGIYIGDGKMIHAATPSQGVIVSDLTEEYLRQHYCGALRLDLSKLPPAVAEHKTGGMAGASIAPPPTAPPSASPTASPAAPLAAHTAVAPPKLGPLGLPLP